MHPILLQFGPVTLYSYGVSIVLAFLVSTWVALHDARRIAPGRVALNAQQLVDLTCFSLLGGVVGARIFYVALYWDVFRHYPQEIIAIWRGGLVWYGGLLGGLAAGWGYVRAQGVSFLRAADQIIPVVALGHAIGRFGCFWNGCCYGKATQAWYGVRFPGGEGPVVPVQLFEAAGLFGLYLLLRWLQRPRAIARRPGWLLSLYLAAYALLRFATEGLRGDQETWWMGLTLQQVLSLALGVAGIILLIMRKGRNAVNA